ncbi:polysaccharide deacetylase family protein [Deinococcus ruber]|uniref:NodB homology domain-containing protein n=1 Tax=Deinococcus ruber TaxID=1848197 RepID=A0A918C6S1_9DEIO|nr:polysaccharide deacetylase family protein [Deinococcus ruber]GGR07560.1 hypothetical protein GCM10008957_20310 [Deinococcus ruber]
MNLGRGLIFVTVLAGLVLAGDVGWQQIRRQSENGPHLQAVVPAVTPPVPVLDLPSVPNLGSSEYREVNPLALKQATPVFTYHDIIRSRQQKGAVWFDCTIAEFEDQMRFLSQHGAHVITLAQLQTHLTRGTPLPPHAVVLTFDDSYQGFFDLAYPVLRRYGYPAAVFVHTNYVGVQTGDHPKMSWDELQQLDQEGLVTIGAHTRSHPADLALLSVAQQDDELRGSKAVLEQHLGHVVNFQTYANGKGDATTFERARLAGYTLGFLEFWGPVEQSPGIMQLNRYIHIQMPRGWNEAYGPDALPTATALPLMSAAPVQQQVVWAGGLRLVLERGGQLQPRQIAGRPELTALVQGRQPGEAAPLLLDVSTSLSSGTVSPLLTPLSAFTLPTDQPTLDALQGRPLVLWSSSGLAILPFATPLMGNEAALRSILPGVNGAFLGGVWLVHGGAALTPTALSNHPYTGLQTAQQRAFLGVDAQGKLVVGVSLTPVSVPRLAAAAAGLNLKEAVMLDSRFTATLAWANLGRSTRAPLLPAGEIPGTVLQVQATAQQP